MLAELKVRNFVLIDELELCLEPGFNVLTGETGAGKSIVVGALSLVLGGRASADVVRPGCEEAEVAARFDLSASPRARERLAASGVEGDELVVRRVVQASGRSRAYLNGRLCTAAELAALAGDLADVSSQHESVQLTDPATHIGYLDAFAALEPERAALAAQVDGLHARVREIHALREVERGRGEREAFLRFQLASIDDVDPRSGELDDLQTERNRLRHARRLLDASRGAADRLYDADGAICDELARLAAELTAAADLDPTLAPVAAALESSRAELTEAARALGRYADGIDTDPSRLEEVDERIFRLGSLVRQHGPTLDDVLAARARLTAELDALGGAEGRLTTLERERDAELTAAATRARSLSKSRRRAADELGTRIGAELKALGMGSARVVVDVASLDGGASDLTVDGARLGRDGIDRVEFLIAPNPGVEPRPLRKIASGGELSRSLLALKRVLAGGGPAGLYVFDEVDAGVGGAIAERIGRAIADVARHRQVLCITHLAPIAACARTQFVVAKETRAGTTTTTVARVRGEARVAEIARMLAGAKVTAAARKAAEEMLAAGKAP